MPKRGNSAKSKIIRRFVESPGDESLVDVIPLIPSEEIARVVEKRYKVAGGTLDSLSAGGLASIIVACDTLVEAGIDPAEYDFTAWLETPQPGPLRGYSPKRYCTFGERSLVIECAERTAEHFRKLTA